MKGFPEPGPLLNIVDSVSSRPMLNFDGGEEGKVFLPKAKVGIGLLVAKRELGCLVAKRFSFKKGVHSCNGVK